MSTKTISSKDINSIATTIRDIINTFLIESETFNFEFFVYCKDQTNLWKINDILDSIKVENFAVEVKYFKKLNDKEIRIENSTFAFFCSSSDLNEFNEISYVDPQYFRIVKIFAFALELEGLNMENYINNDEEKNAFKVLAYEFFLKNTRNSIDLTSFEMFQYGNCRKPQIVTLNSFIKKTQKWTKSLENYEKFKNFNECPRVQRLAYGFSFYIPNAELQLNFHLLQKAIENGKHVIVGEKINNEIAKRANYSLLYQFYMNTYDDQMKLNKVVVPVNGSVLKGDEKIATITYENPDHLMVSVTSPSFDLGSNYLVVPKGEPFSKFEKLFLPFDRTTWQFFGITFGVAFAVIFFINQMEKRYQNIFYGSGVTAPSFNVIGTFFGIGQVKLPDNNFARIILIIFIFFCLIFRTGYQGVFFEMLSTDMRQLSIQNPEEILEKNFTVAFFKSRELFHRLKFFFAYDKRLLYLPVDIPNMPELYYKTITNTSAKMAFFLPREELNQIQWRTGLFGTRLKAFDRRYPASVGTNRNSLLFPIVNNIVEKLSAAGIIQLEFEFLTFVEIPSSPPPKVLSIDDLDFGFVVCDINSVSKTIHDVIDVFLIKEIIFDFELFVFCKNDKNLWKFHKILNEIKTEYPLEIKFINKLKGPRNFVKKSAIAFFCNINDLNEFNQISYVDTKLFRVVKFFVFTFEPKGLNVGFHKSEKATYHKILMYEFFINNTKNSIDLNSFEMFQHGKCKKPQIVTLNRFIKKTQQWEKDLVNYEKFRNFNGCPRVIKLQYGFGFGFTKKLEENMENSIKLIETGQYIIDMERIFNDFAKKANYTVLYQFYKYIVQKDLNFTTHIIPAFGIYPTAEETIGKNSYDVKTWPVCSFTSPSFDISPNIFVVPHGESFSNYEKLFLPFDGITWIFFGLTFGVAFGIIFLINQMKKLVQNIFYGFRVTAPSLNVLRNFFGIGQVRLPENNFARIILIFFVYFCLVFRVGYQGVFFEMLTTDMRKPSIQTPEEILERNFTIITYLKNEMVDHLLDFFNKDKRLSYALVELNEMPEAYKSKIKNPSAKTAFFLPRTELDQIEFSTKTKGIRLKHTDERYPSSIATLRNSLIFPIVNEIVERLSTAGIVQYEFEIGSSPKFVPDPLPLKVLSIDDLAFGFVVWLIACTVSIFGFSCEIFLKLILVNGKIVLKEIIGIYLFIGILKKRLRRI